MRVLTANVRRNLRGNFITFVGAVQHVFRVRGHHYIDRAEEIESQSFHRLYERTLKGSVASNLMEEIFGVITYKQLSRDALHAIPPYALISYTYANIDVLSQPLKIRLSAFPAGAAILGFLKTGMQDILTALPHLKRHMASVVVYYDEIMAEYDVDDWRVKMQLSVNHNLYGLPAAQLDQQRFAAITSMVLSAFQTMKPDCMLVRSLAAKRVSESAPITGAVFARYIKHYTKSEKMLNAMDNQNPVQAPNQNQNQNQQVV